MRKENVKVAIWGFGAMGSGMARMLTTKKGIEVVGVCDRNEERVGKDMYEVLGIERGDHQPVIISSNIDEVLDQEVDICLTATDSFTEKAFPRLKVVLEKGVNVISTAEEMAFPKASNPDLARELDRIARENGVSILGTGINPGLIMDLLVVTLTGCMTDVTHIEAKRVNSLSPFGPAVMEEQGVGLTLSEFEAGVADGSLAGHVGFRESVGMIAEAIGWEVENFAQQMLPIITSVDRQAPHAFVKAGDVAGVSMTGQGYVDGEVKIDMIHPQQIEPEMEETYTGDYITLKGSPEVNMQISPEVDGGLGTIAMCVNMIPQVINADPGLKTMLDLPVPRAMMGDVRKYVK
ncbi:MAG: dihydrodipicolinate reductase [delta proteobacterium ML8_F1]|nr:MAG: dihydrodipicolinate reductase [delta proteobacterium ML8_F1]